jgi:16S rRNA (adenine1518-N6/adenine1519-N6)-dimethyltransferase
MASNIEIIEALPSLFETVKQYGLLENKNHSKRLGQNFLLDYNVTKKIVRLSDSLENKYVIEIGPGPGGLTRAILEQNPKQLHVVDMDTTCIKVMNDLKKKIPTLIPHHCDALKFDINSILLSTEKVYILSNLPYHIGTELLIGWLKMLNRIDGMVLMFQKEVADRIIANPGSKTYGRLSIISQYCCEIEHGLDLSPHYFTPAPKIHSTVLRFVPKKSADLSKLPFLERVTGLAFGNRRKMLRSSLKTILGEEDFVILNIDAQKRAENLTGDEFLKIADYVAKHISISEDF